MARALADRLHPVPSRQHPRAAPRRIEHDAGAGHTRRLHPETPRIRLEQRQRSRRSIVIEHERDAGIADVFTAEQMREYAKKAMDVELERCITELERNADKTRQDKTLEDTINAIRARSNT